MSRPRGVKTHGCSLSPRVKHERNTLEAYYLNFNLATLKMTFYKY